MALSLTPSEKAAIVETGIAYGTTMRFNHKSCTAGTDTRRRLYATHDRSGDYLVFCHNCGQGTKIWDGGPRVRSVPAPATMTPAAKLPTPLPMPDLGQLFIKAWGLVPEDEYWVDTAGARGICFPFVDGYQIRWLEGSTLKWQTFGDPKYSVVGTDILICEDAISARKWLQADPDNGVMCLFGAKVAAAHPIDVGLASESMFLVWLDNDQKHIDEVATNISKKLGSAWSKNVVLCRGGTDPKRYTKEELLNVRDEARKLCGTTPPVDQPYHVLEVPIPNQRVRAGLGVKRNSA